MQMRQVAAIVFSSFLVGVQPRAQADLPATDPRIRTEVVTAAKTRKAGEPIVIDVYIQNREREDIQKRQFSPISSQVGLPTFRIVKVPEGDEILLPAGLFVKAPDDWDNWYQPASGRDAYQVGSFVLPAGARIHLLHGDLRRMVHAAGEYCQGQLAEGTLLEEREAAATKKEYENIVRFARQFAAGGVFDLTVWAYARSNTVRIRVESSTK
jgi:hypothetical protein